MIVEQASFRRIGGEMYAFSDHDPARGPGIARSGALRHVLTELGSAGRTTLVAGPHDDTLVAGLLDTGALVTCLVRSVLDAERLVGLFPAATVLCGSIAKLDPTARFDLVVAADGVDRLGSTEGEQVAFAEVLTTLAGAVADGGSLALMTDNLLGIHHTVELDPAGHYGSDAAWYPVSEFERPRPASLAQLRDQLALAGLPAGDVYAVFPTPATATVLVGEELLGDVTSPVRGQVGAALTQAFTEEYRDVPVLRDPRPLVGRALRAGAESALAPAWLTIVRRGAAEPAPRHALVVSSGATYEVSASGARTLTPATAEQRGGMRRVTDPAAYVGPGGRIFEERLFELCALVDVPGLRAELSRLVTWIEQRAVDGLVAGPDALATPDTVLDDGDELRLTPPAWEPVAAVPVDVVVARALWRFAVRLITAGQPHPWQLTSSAVDLTTTMLATVGRQLTEANLRAAVDLQVDLDAAERDLALPEQDTRRLELLAVQPGRATVDVAGYRELEEALWRQRYQVAHLLAGQEWTEHIIGSRDNALSKMDWEIQLFRASFFGKLLMLGKAFYRSLRRDSRKALGKVKRAVSNGEREE